MKVGVATGWRVGGSKQGVVTAMVWISFRGDKNVPELGSGDGYTTL